MLAGIQCQHPHYSGVWFGAGYQQDLPYGFSAGFTQEDSNIPLYSYSRNQFQIGVTSLF
jgi:hypothetical protein